MKNEWKALGIDLLESKTTLRADIEFTSDCNLKCVY
jgi:hypothetical protein